MYSTSSGGATVMELYSIENNTAKSGKLFFTNVRNMELSSSNNPTGTAANIAVPSATVLSKSGRPPIAGASRQESASILHDGVEPMTILAITLKGQFGADN